MELTWISCLAALASAAIAYLLWAHTYWLRRGTPQTRPWLLLGDVWDTIMRRRTMGDVLAEIHEKSAPHPFVGFYKLLQPILLVKDPELVKEVLQQNFSSFANNEAIFPPGKDEVFSENPFTADIERWKPLRARLSQMFSPVRVRVAFADLLESAQALVTFIEASDNQKSHQGTDLARRFTAHASARVLFGIESHSLEVGNPPGPFYQKAFSLFNGGIVSQLRFMAFFLCPSLLNVIGYSFVSDDTVSFFRKLMRDSVEYRQKEGIVRDDFVQHASKLILVDGKVDEAALSGSVGQAINSYVETVETSAFTLSLVLLLLATNPDKQDKLRQELRTALPADRPFNIDELHSVAYLEWVVMEALRLLPVSDTLRRACTKATTLQADGASVSLRPGDVVYVCVQALHADPSHYEQPDKFHPEHFSLEQSQARHKMAFLGFGEGPRMCPGMRYGVQQIKVALACILLRLKVEPGPEQVLPLQRDPQASVFGVKGGIWLRFSPVA